MAPVFEGRLQRLIGDRAEAVSLLNGALRLGYLDAWIDRNPDFLSLKDDPEFQSIVAEVKKKLHDQ